MCGRAYKKWRCDSHLWCSPNSLHYAQSFTYPPNLVRNIAINTGEADERNCSQ